MSPGAAVGGGGPDLLDLEARSLGRVVLRVGAPRLREIFLPFVVEVAQQSPGERAQQPARDRAALPPDQPSDDRATHRPGPGADRRPLVFPDPPVLRRAPGQDRHEQGGDHPEAHDGSHEHPPAISGSFLTHSILGVFKGEPAFRRLAP